MSLFERWKWVKYSHTKARVTFFVCQPLKLKQAETAYISSDLTAAAVLHLMQNTLFFLLIRWGKVKSSLMDKTNNECWYWCDTSLSNTGGLEIYIEIVLGWGYTYNPHWHLSVSFSFLPPPKYLSSSHTPTHLHRQLLIKTTFLK